MYNDLELEEARKKVEISRETIPLPAQIVEVNTCGR